MRALMGLIKDRHGTYYAQKKVPERLQEAVARALNNGKAKQVYLKKSLGTKDLKAANVAAKHVLAGFDRTLGQAEDLIKARPVLTTLAVAQIKRLAETYHASVLESDEEERREGTGSEPVYRAIAEQLTAEGVEFDTPFLVGPQPEAGLSSREIFKREELLAEQLPPAAVALAKGDITHVSMEVDELLDMFQINLDRKSLAYRQLGMAVLAAHVKALKDLERRNAGEPIETPTITHSTLGPHAASGGTLREAFDGWDKARVRPDDTVTEYKRAVEMFVQLHGNLAVAEIKRRHALDFRDAIQSVPRRRAGKLRSAPLPELSTWGKEHPSVARVGPGTINKQLGALQAVCTWARDNDLVSADISWSDPFQRLRVEEDQSERAPFVASELQTVFNAPLFTSHEWPVGARGAAGVWLPLLSLFTGARQSELAGLKASNIKEDDETGTPLMYIVSDRKTGRRLKTKPSERVIPIHPQLLKLGFLKLVAERRHESADAWLFPLVSPAKARSGVKAWSKWFGSYLRNKVGMKDTTKVFHSFRHGVQDALRRATPDEELRDAIQGRSGQKKSVSRDYGAKEMLARWGVEALKEAVSKISYPGLDLSRVKPFPATKRARGSK